MPSVAAPFVVRGQYAGDVLGTYHHLLMAESSQSKSRDTDINSLKTFIEQFVRPRFVLLVKYIRLIQILLAIG